MGLNINSYTFSISLEKAIIIYVPLFIIQFYKVSTLCAVFWMSLKLTLIFFSLSASHQADYNLCETINSLLESTILVKRIL